MTSPIPDPDEGMPSDLLVALELAQMAGYLETASIKDDRKRRIVAVLVDGAQRLAFAAFERKA